jgi:hypothetical protein
MTEKLDLSVSASQQIAKSVYAGLAFGIIMSFYFSWRYGWVIGSVAGLASGIFFGLGIGLFAHFVGKSGKAMFPAVKLGKGEKALGIILANHKEHAIAMGGKMLITNKGIRFVPHHVNIGAHSVFIPYKKIKKVYKAKRSLIDVYSGGLMQRLAIETEKDLHLFVVDHRDRIIEFIGNKIR